MEAAEVRRHGGGGDAARMRARGIAQGGRVRGGLVSVYFVGPTYPLVTVQPRWSVGTLFPCSVSLFFFSSTASFPLSFLYSHPFPAPSLPPARLPRSYTYHRPFFFALSLFSPSLFFLTLSVSLYLATVYVYNITHSFAPHEQQRRYNIKKNSGLPDGSAPVFFDYFASTVFPRCNPTPARRRSALHLFHLSTRREGCAFCWKLKRSSV